ncbi:MAG TPA: hypothetical protein VFZ87_04275 [Gemmatimonadales bacterium]
MAERLRRELLWLVGGVLLVDAVFAASYFLADLRNTSDMAKVAFTAMWTLVTLGVVLRGLSRIRRVRLESRDIRSS